MNVIVVGYGKMGQEVERLCQSAGIGVSAVIRGFDELKNCPYQKGDVVIDFTHPGRVLGNIEYYLEQGIPAVIGTTGWYDELREVEKRCLEKGGALLYGANFSIGVLLFFEMVRRGAELINLFDEYDASVLERHHRFKKDSPSGTALALGQIVIEQMDKKDGISTDVSREGVGARELCMGSIRAGYVVGEHEVSFDSPWDDIRLTHRAKSREGFAKGALECAQWLREKKGFFSVDDYVDDLLKSLKKQA